MARIGKNEALFREVNERVKTVNESFSLVTQRADFVCECGDQACMDRITMALDEYERIRAEATWFLTREGHEIADVETVIERHPGYQVVAKLPGPPAALADEQDPRSA